MSKDARESYNTMLKEANENQIAKKGAVSDGKGPDPNKPRIMKRCKIPVFFSKYMKDSLPVELDAATLNKPKYDAFVAKVLSFDNLIYIPLLTRF